MNTIRVELTERQIFVIKKAISYAISNLDELNEAMADCDGELIESTELDDASSELVDLRGQY